MDGEALESAVHQWLQRKERNFTGR